MSRCGRRSAAGAVLALAVALPVAARGAAWSIRAFGGTALNLRTPLTIRQAGEPPLQLRASWATRPLDAPPYVGVGVARRSGGHEWSLEYVHHKLYLHDPPPEVQAFSVSHGYNLVLLGAGREVAPGLWARGGAGVVVAHPESTVRGRTLDEGRGLLGLGFYLGGPVVSGGIEARAPARTRLQVTLGVRVTAAYAVVPVEGGHAAVPNVALHANVGVAGDLVP